MLRRIGFLFAFICTAQPAPAWQPGTPLAVLQPPPFVGNVNGSPIAGLPLPQADINCVTRQAYQNGIWGDPVNFINMVRALPIAPTIRAIGAPRRGASPVSAAAHCARTTRVV